jgi:hypothetical protein
LIGAELERKWGYMRFDRGIFGSIIDLDKRDSRLFVSERAIVVDEERLGIQVV